jgi:hypothetical protein
MDVRQLASGDEIGKVEKCRIAIAVMRGEAGAALGGPG